MNEARGSWRTITPYESATRSELPELKVLIDADGFQIQTGQWPNRDDIDELTICGHVGNGAVVFTEMSIRSPSITVDTPRVPIGDLRAAFATWLKSDPNGIDIRTQMLATDLDEESREWLRTQVEQAQTAASQANQEIRSSGRLPGRPPLEDDLIRQVAEVYVEEFPSSGRRIIQVVTERLETMLNRPKLKSSTVKNWVRRARQDGWLAGASRGHPNGSPGARLIDYWKKTDKENSDEGE